MNLVTGASGFIGSRIVHALVKRGEKVRILVRPEANLLGIEGLDYELLTGNVNDRESIGLAVKGCQRVYHAAAVYQLWTKNRKAMYETNVEGTRHVMEEGVKAGIERIVYTSSVATIGVPPNGIGTEDTTVTFKDMIGDYKKSKFLAEEVVKEFIQQGAPAVIVNPTYPVGEGDVKPTPTGKVIVDFLKGKMHAYIDTGMNVVDVDDVAVGHILAAEKGEIGRRYILGNSNMTLRTLLELLADITGLPGPFVKLPYYPVLALAFIDSTLSREIPGRTPMIPLDGVRMAHKKMFVDTLRAVTELGLPQTPPRAALEKAVNWFRKHGYV
jgi:dihydroflavonol-4-reductase